MNKKYNHTVQTLMAPDTADPSAAACASSMHFPVLTTWLAQVQLLLHLYWINTACQHYQTSNFNELFNFNLGSKLKAITVLVTHLTSCRSYVNCKRQKREHFSTYTLVDDRAVHLASACHYDNTGSLIITHIDVLLKAYSRPTATATL
jgi:hypothetical protein